MAPFSPQALTPRKRQIEKSIEKADSIIRSGTLGINKRNFYGSIKRTRPRLSHDCQAKEQDDVKKVDVYDFDENGEALRESVFSRLIKPHEIGFPNPPGTNICWMNASLQIILGMRCVIDDLEYPGNGSPLSRNHLSSILQSFLDVLRQYRRGRLLPVHKNLSNLRAALSTLDSGFACEYQQDAPEFLIRLLDKFREDFYEMGKSENNNGETIPLKELSLNNCNGSFTQSCGNKRRVNPICDNLQFSMKENYCCTSCGMQSEKSQEHLALYVDVPVEKEACTSVKSALEQYMKTHIRELRCEKCEGAQCQVNTVFTQLPRYLLIQLKRYTYLEHLTQKITNLIAIPLELNVGNVVDSNVILPKPLPTDQEKENDINAENEVTEPTINKKHGYLEEEAENYDYKYCYRLTGILSHHGDNPNTGHYVADVFQSIPQRWYHYDDENVESVGEDEVLDESREKSGYLFVYTYRHLHEQLAFKPSDGF
ncbi:hypothetical protein R5R35_003322 [Gryllus longicercus]|uniref:USP domain-containing protein n=1 Tax=Gryllus longicercus TaxID=2509291 RepID=A0AAN9VMN6_9ORTH